MADARYYEAALQVPAAEVPNDCTVAQRKFEIARHGGMIALRLGPTVPGPEGETYGALMSTSQATAIIQTLEVRLANIGR